jgi:hypothetical protein
MSAPAFAWPSYLKLAEELANSTDEGSLRTAISRAYYYVYHLGLERAERNGFARNPNEPAHSQLWVIYSGNPDAACKKLAEIANRIKFNRVKADYYHIFPGRLAEETNDTIESAKDFASKLDNLRISLPKPESVRWGARR